MKYRLYLILFILVIALLIAFSPSPVKSEEHYSQVKGGSNQVTESAEDTSVPLSKQDPGQNNGLINDPLFRDVIYYENDPLTYHDDGTYDGDTGWDKCVAQNNPKKGVCLEFGISGDTYFFPNDPQAGADEYTKALQKMLVSTPNSP